MENPAQGARLSCQLMKELKTLPAYKDTLEHFLAHGNHVRYSSHEWFGTWCDYKNKAWRAEHSWFFHARKAWWSHLQARGRSLRAC